MSKTATGTVPQGIGMTAQAAGLMLGPVGGTLRRLGRDAKAWVQSIDAERRRWWRAPIDLWGWYTFPDDAETGTCRVVDISEDGAGVELFGNTPDDPIGRVLRVEITGPDGSMGIQITGVVRNVAVGRLDGARVGIEFARSDAVAN